MSQRVVGRPLDTDLGGRRFDDQIHANGQLGRRYLAGGEFQNASGVSRGDTNAPRRNALRQPENAHLPIQKHHIDRAPHAERMNAATRHE